MVINMVEKLIKSKTRVREHGEVFTPKWMVKKMLAPKEIQDKLHSLHGTFLEPSAGEGAFLVEILCGKLDYVNEISKKTTWVVNALWALMSIYAVELMQDNLRIAKNRMIEIIGQYYEKATGRRMTTRSDFYKSMRYILDMNILQGNFLTCKNDEGKDLVFNFWNVVDKKTVKRQRQTLSAMLGCESDDVDDEEDAQLSLFGDTTVKDFDACPVTKVYREAKHVCK